MTHTRIGTALDTGREATKFCVKTSGVAVFCRTTEYSPVVRSELDNWLDVSHEFSPITLFSILAESLAPIQDENRQNFVEKRPLDEGRNVVP